MSESSRTRAVKKDDFLMPTQDKPDPPDMSSHHFSHHDQNLSFGTSMRDRPTQTLSRSSPLRASHDLGLASIHGDTDSGISTRLRPSFSSLSPRVHNTTHDGLASSRSYDHNSPRSSRSLMRSSGGSHESLRSPSPLLRSASSPVRAPSAERKVSDLQLVLDESEQRRVLLTQKLKDAQDTIETQSGRLRSVESSVQNNSSTLEDMRYREKELQKRLSAAEKERDDQQRKRLEEARASKKLHDTVESLEDTISHLRIHKDQLQSEAIKKKEVMDSATSTLTILEQENTKLSKENAKLAEEKRSSGAQLAALKKDNLLLKEESNGLSNTMQGLKDENFRVDHELGRLRAALADLQASLASTTSDKERYFREKLDLHQKLQQVSHERDALLRSKTSVEEQLNDLQDQVTEARRGMDKMRAERASLEQEFASVKKVGEGLSSELGNTRQKLEKATEQALGMEQTHRLSEQQQHLYQQEVHSLENQVDTLKKSMENLRKDNIKDKESLEAHQLKLKEEIRHLKAERNQLELKVHELEARVKHCDLQLREEGEVGRREVDKWRREAEKVTASLERRDAEIEELQNKISELDEELSVLRLGRENQQAQYEELLEAREELMRLREENRRMCQERGENQQVIQLLEMQKNILSKMSENNMGKVHDTEQLQCKVDRLTAENNLLQDKNHEIERERDVLLKEKEDRLWNSSDDDGSSPRSGQGRMGRGGQKQTIIDDLEQQNEQLLKLNTTITEQLTRLQQENAAMKEKQGEMLTRSEFQKVESVRAALEQDLSRLRMQYEQLEQRHHDVIADRHIAESEEVSAAQKERDTVEARLTLVKGDLVLAENARVQQEERAAGLERQLEQATVRASNSMRDREQTADLELRVAQLTSDLEGARDVLAKQEQLITSLREQSLDDVGNELTNMRTELQKLLEVIQVKDQAIEDLEARLEDTRKEIHDRDRMIEQLTSSIRSGGDLQGVSQRTDTDMSAIGEQTENGSESTRAELLQRISELEEERDELRVQADALFKERDLAIQDADDLRDGIDDLQQMFDEDRVKLQEQYRKDIRAKERQIEALEEQLRSMTNNELRKLKRDAGRVELLRTENRILQNQLSHNLRSSNVYASAVNHDYPAFIAPPEEDPPEPAVPETQPTTTAPTHTPAPPQSGSFDDTGNFSLAHSRSYKEAREFSELKRETFETITTEKDVNEAVALLGGISLADLDSPPIAKYQNIVDDGQILNSQHIAVAVADDITVVSEQSQANVIKNSLSGELTLADLESDIESTDTRRTPSVPGSSHVTRALRLADLEHKASDNADYRDPESGVR